MRERQDITQKNDHIKDAKPPEPLVLTDPSLKGKDTLMSPNGQVERPTEAGRRPGYLRREMAKFWATAVPLIPTASVDTLVS
jgi:hypothetical protein